MTRPGVQGRSGQASAHDTEARGPAELVREEILSAASYRVEDPEGMVKLDAMENPHDLPPVVRDAWLRVLADTAVNRYPDAAARALKDRLRQRFQVPAGAGILLGNGSDEIIQILCTALARPGASLLAAEPSFAMYRGCATIAGLRYTGVPLGPGFALDEDAMCEAMDREHPCVTFIAQPNNPTGNLVEAAVLERLVARAPGLVVVDEAYQGFTRVTAMPLLERYGNLMVMRTLSKAGMAGLRLGFMAGAPRWIAEFDKVRLPYNIGSLTQAGACCFLDHLEEFDRQLQRIVAERDALLAGLRELPGIEVWPSAANFLLFRHRSVPGRDMFEGLRQRGVLVRNLDGVHPMLADCLRVSVGTADETGIFLARLRELLAAQASAD